MERGRAETLGKPKPLLSSEAAKGGLRIPFERRHKVIGIEYNAAYLKRRLYIASDEPIHRLFLVISAARIEKVC